MSKLSELNNKTSQELVEIIRKSRPYSNTSMIATRLLLERNQQLQQMLLNLLEEKDRQIEKFKEHTTDPVIKFAQEYGLDIFDASGNVDEKKLGMFKRLFEASQGVSKGLYGSLSSQKLVDELPTAGQQVSAPANIAQIPAPASFTTRVKSVPVSPLPYDIDVEVEEQPDEEPTSSGAATVVTPTVNDEAPVTVKPVTKNINEEDEEK